VSVQSASLRGLRVLVVEDEFPILLMLEDMLTELGCVVAGSASRVAAALELLKAELPAAAVLDVNVAGEEVYPVAEILAANGVPFVFSTGYGASGVHAPWSSRPILQKPFRIDQLENALATAVRQAVTR
jgi:CheY-like chemotaxis protein